MDEPRRNAIEDAAALTVGLGVAAARAARKPVDALLDRREDLRDRLESDLRGAVDAVRDLAGGLKDRTETIPSDVRARIDEVRDRVEPVADRVRERTEPLADRLRESLPDPLAKAVDTGRKQVRDRILPKA